MLYKLRCNSDAKNLVSIKLWNQEQSRKRRLSTKFADFTSHLTDARMRTGLVTTRAPRKQPRSFVQHSVSLHSGLHGAALPPHTQQDQGCSHAPGSQAAAASWQRSAGLKVKPRTWAALWARRTPVSGYLVKLPFPSNENMTMIN